MEQEEYEVYLRELAREWDQVENAAVEQIQAVQDVLTQDEIQEDRYAILGLQFAQAAPDSLPDLSEIGSTPPES